ncbi:MAG: hypothetical protein OK454_11910, partial [Thaumarchaeota archaeon]|nr:hypothetical protein [Nitrososphaerota archaeon]
MTQQARSAVRTEEDEYVYPDGRTPAQLLAELEKRTEKERQERGGGPRAVEVIDEQVRRLEVVEKRESVELRVPKKGEMVTLSIFRCPVHPDEQIRTQDTNISAAWQIMAMCRKCNSEGVKLKRLVINTIANEF